ncbi:D-2-hydroxyacid dehydrogenase [Shewanella avicenniae]|uniref:D-2-hydroxyacid dehydrogenase n=1 Tax=Shewanella avicenniae TaxID=2814294 RepID=A0ABX7QTT1_9GAMM|nr:D-2-hydroxyacid dehydrogenase [Shewanella avicenniae]QSX34320.1 D-2-hydroxyacid dehydrogenase [Shewanella avicenniae]
MSHKLLLLTRENEIYHQLLSDLALPNLTIVDEQPAQISSTDIWLAEPGLAAPLISVGHSLQWLQSTFAGVDKLMQLKRPLSCQLTNIKGVFGPLMSEYVFGYLLNIYRQQGLYAAQQRQQLWQEGEYRTLQGKTLVVLGTGSIGSHLAQTAHHFGMKALGVSRRGRATAGFERVYEISQFASIISCADVLVNALPHTPQTVHLLNGELLSKLPQNATLFNVGRGSAIILDELTQLLQQRADLTAVLDVFEQEPLHSSHKIWQQANAIITPHIAAPSFPEQVVQIFADNYQRFCQQQPLMNLVDISAGY